MEGDISFALSLPKELQPNEKGTTLQLIVGPNRVTPTHLRKNEKKRSENSRPNPVLWRERGPSLFFPSCPGLAWVDQ